MAQKQLTAIDMNGNAVSNLPTTPASANDAASKAYVDANAGGATNLTTSTTSTSVTVISDTGTDGVISSATTSNAGVLAASDKTKLDGIATGAQVNSFVRVIHGATASTARPSGVTHVEWVGSVAPTNANTTNDTWIDTA